jgi:hypothetical protein
VAWVAPPAGLTEIQQKRTSSQIPAQSLIFNNPIWSTKEIPRFHFCRSMGYQLSEFAIFFASSSSITWRRIEIRTRVARVLRCRIGTRALIDCANAAAEYAGAASINAHIDCGLPFTHYAIHRPVRRSISQSEGRFQLEGGTTKCHLYFITLVQIRISICERKEAEHLLA